MDRYCCRCMKPLASDETCCSACGFVQADYTAKSHQLPNGTLLSDRYAVGMVLGEGGFGITYVGLDTRLGRKIAIKEFYMSGYVSRYSTFSYEVQVSDGATESIFLKNRDRFLDEAKVLASFSEEPGIVGIHDYFLENGTAYIVMEFLDGITLKEQLKQTGRISWEQTKEIFRPVLNSLNEVHKHGIIHRDISPDNIMLTKRGQVKLLDFGAAREFSQDNGKSLSVILKHGFAPEEQYRSKGQQGPWTDVYALCATMYRCLTGITPDEAMERLVDDQLKPPAELCDCSQSVSDALMKGLAVFRRERIQTVEELIAALENVEQPAIERFTEKLLPISTDPEATVYARSTSSELVAESAAPKKPRESASKQKKISGKLILVIIVALLAVLIWNVIAIITERHNPPSDISEEKPDAAIAETESTPGRTEEIPISSDEQVPDAIVETVPAESDSANALVMATGNNHNNQCDVSEWQDIVDIAAGLTHTIGLRSDGTVVAAGQNNTGECNVNAWKNIEAIAAGYGHSVGLRANGTVVACGNNAQGQCNVANWTNIIAIAAGGGHTVGVRSDGTVLAVGLNTSDQCNVETWTDIVAVAAGSSHTFGLRSNGTVVIAGDSFNLIRSFRGLEEWTNVIAIATNDGVAFGLRDDGSVLCTSSLGTTTMDANNAEWTDIIAISANGTHVVGLRSDGTVVADGANNNGQCNVEDWTDIAAISAGGYHTVGLRKQE